MFRTFSLFMRAGARTAQNHTDQTLALPLLHEDIALAARGVQKTREATALLCAHAKAETKRLDAITARIHDMENRTRAALAAGEDALAREAAGILVTLEEEQRSLSESVALYKAQEDKLRQELVEAESRLRALDRGFRIAKARDMGQKMQGAFLPTNTGISSAENRLKTLQDRQDLNEAARHAIKDMQMETRADIVRDKLADAGFGPSQKPCIDAVLDRLRAPEKQSATNLT